VIKFNFVNSAGMVLPDSAFTYDDPSTWSAPAGGNAANGQTLWNTAILTAAPINPAHLGATCGACHTHDGRDLKYFNYSNKAIEVRAQFHGLSAQNGLDLAAYIRTLPLNASVGGRPWNPVYQPGPGMDAKPVYEWAAGAGIDNVLDNDVGTYNDMFPNGINAAAADPSGDINVRQTRISLQFMDWNHWLPHTHPSDAWGAASFAPFLTRYNQMRADLTAGNLNTFMNDYDNFLTALDGDTSFVTTKELPQYNPPWSPAYAQKVYDIELWNMVKHWEFFNEFNLQTQADNQQVLGISTSLLEPRGWFTGEVFNASPNI